MPAVEWNESFSVGHPGLDEQHRKLFGAINDLYDATRGRQATAESRRALEFLIDYTRTHFADEEALMEAKGYPGLAEHRAEHMELIANLQEFGRRLARSEADPFVEEDLIYFLTGAWLVDHVMTTDQKYAAVL
jgi:hemerythrin